MGLKAPLKGTGGRRRQCLYSATQQHIDPTFTGKNRGMAFSARALGRPTCERSFVATGSIYHQGEASWRIISFPNPTPRVSLIRHKNTFSFITLHYGRHDDDQSAHRKLSKHINESTYKSPPVSFPPAIERLLVQFTSLHLIIMRFRLIIPDL